MITLAQATLALVGFLSVNLPALLLCLAGVLVLQALRPAARGRR